MKTAKEIQEEILEELKYQSMLLAEIATEIVPGKGWSRHRKIQMSKPVFDENGWCWDIRRNDMPAVVWGWNGCEVTLVIAESVTVDCWTGWRDLIDNEAFILHAWKLYEPPQPPKGGE